MKRLFFGLAAVALSLASAGISKADFTLDVTTHYQFGGPPGTTDGTLNTQFGNPDTGFFIITNNGASTFSGTIGDVAVAGIGTDFSFTSGSLVLAPGHSIAVGVNDESSNFGGFNGPTGTTQNGVEILLMGLINGVEAVNLSVFDKDIHSGVPRNANGNSSDSYVLQGGDPTGGDTGDAFETTQADGHFRFFEAPSLMAPEPSSLTLCALGVLGLLGYGWRKRQQVA
jgi:hypothetical protein